MYPIEKYRFYEVGKKVIAVTTYAGKTVRGVAVCHDGDTFDLEFGKKLAAARCNIKVARKRVACARKKIDEDMNKLNKIELHYDKMLNYFDDAVDEFDKAINAESDLIVKISK